MGLRATEAKDQKMIKSGVCQLTANNQCKSNRICPFYFVQLSRITPALFERNIFFCENANYV